MILGKGFPGRQLVIQGFGESLAEIARAIIDGLTVLDFVGLPTLACDIGLEEIALKIEKAITLLEFLSGAEELEVPIHVIAEMVNEVGININQIVQDFQSILPILELAMGQETVILERALPPVEINDGVAEINLDFPVRMVVNA